MSAPCSPSSRKRAAGDESDASGVKKARVENPEAASTTPADDFEEGEIGESPSGSEAASPKDNEAEAESTPAQGGWNRGVSSGLRTSFISLSTSSLRNKSQKKDPSPETTPERETAVPNTRTRSQTRSKSSSPTDRNVVDGWLALPPHEPFAHFKARPRYPESWQKRFMDFCEALIRHNIRWPQTTMDEAQAQKMNNPDLLYKAWGRWLQDHADQKFCSHDQLAGGIKQASATRLYTPRLAEVISEALGGKGQEPGGSETQAQEPKKKGKFAQASWTQFTLQGTKFENLTIPPLDSKSDLDEFKKRKDRWKARFLQWSQDFISLNQGLLTSDSPELLGVIWTSWCNWFKQIVNKNKIPVGKDVARNFFLENNEDVEAVYHAIMAASPRPAQDETEEPPKHEETEEAADEQSGRPQAAAARNEEQQQQLSQPTTPRNEDVDLHIRHKYFCGLGHNQLFCIECASYSHDSSQCPLLTCRWCRAVAEHPSYACPTRRRCTACRQLGHDAETCTEKLAVPRDQMECAICGSTDGHLEETCPELWRTYKPDPLTSSKVKALPIYCYCCGNAGHYGADCGMNMGRPAMITVWETWSKSNVEQLYVDPESDKVAIALKPMPKGSVLTPYNEEDPYADWDAGSNGRPDFGHSIAPQRHVFFEDDDEDEEDEGFIRPPVVNKNQGPSSAPHGRINFGAGNRGGRGKSGGGTGGQRHNPPLPPGPPPQRLREFQSYNHGRGGDSFRNGPGGGGGGRDGGRGGFGGGRRGRGGKKQWSRGHH
ncbi:hypothetical protein QBC32DRAFT_103762 [Pseudoneurospora amorphoporcata]|uniref:CCHC-type domain-containing protein n=1 Tax=Pseudoneurospora amorphoporcata TaxID=241081 RepID=A0AAN6NXV5_9PEZI|nr:hypothetical protein QBC32DRAFT_103762 [Pseudoneurospora amorphoporcata]